MKRILAVLDKDKDYAGALASFANERELTPFCVVAFSDISGLKDFNRRQPVDLLLAASDTPEDELKNLEISQIMILCEESRVKLPGQKPEPPGEGRYFICKYQSCDALFREVMENLRTGSVEVSSENTKGEIIGVCSPAGRCGKTGFALTLGQILAEDFKVMYLNLEEFSGLAYLTGNTYGRSLSDLIYAMRQGSLNESIIGSALYKLGDLDYIAPVSSGEDIEEIRSEELAELTRRLSSQEHYQALIMDMGSMGKNAFPLLELCSVIYAPTKDDAVTQAKMAEWEKQLTAYGGTDLFERVRVLRLPIPAPAAGRENYISQLLYGEMGKMVRELLREEK